MRNRDLPYSYGNAWLFGLVAFTMILALVVLGLGGCSGQDRSVTTAWNVYHGEVPGYRVEIDESQHNGVQQWSRIVHLRPVGGRAFDQEPRFDWRCEHGTHDCGITGHDYNGDGRWDRAYLCGYPDPGYGCNAVLFTSGQQIYAYGTPSVTIAEWKPCPANEKMPQFSNSDVEAAIGQLDLAMANAHNPEHRSWTLEEWKKRHDHSETNSR